MNKAKQAGADRVRQVVDPVVQGADLYLEDVTVAPAGSRSVVRITLDLPEDAVGNLDLDRVAEVSRSINTALDESDAFPGAYTLEISTPAPPGRSPSPATSSAPADASCASRSRRARTWRVASARSPTVACCSPMLPSSP
ncbi:hypothetical protein NKG05_01135 [Oerskovia sp. M15]